MPKVLPREITSYDLAKTFAVVFMVIDHAGFFFFFDDVWWRVAGRLCVPVWFFLIGYAKSRDTGGRLWIGGALLAAGFIVSGQQIFPLNILFTMILIRSLIDPLMERALKNREMFRALNVFLFLAAIPSSMIFDYGTLGFIVAIYGWLVRHRDELAPEQKNLVKSYFIFSYLSFVVIQYICFGLDQVPGLALLAGIFCVMSALYFFRPVTFPRLSAALPGFATAFLRFTGRRTLEIYVAHLLFFSLIGMIIMPERFTLLDWSLFYRVKP